MSNKFVPVLARVDVPLALKLSNAAVGIAPAPYITFKMVRLAQHVGKIVHHGGSKANLLPLYVAALFDDRQRFASLFYSLLSDAESVIIGELETKND
jgi:hypothetical protein